MDKKNKLTYNDKSRVFIAHIFFEEVVVDDDDN
jgi:hypothetical protein